jgi:hypothetical protein
MPTGPCCHGFHAYHGFVRAPDGTIVTFDVPASHSTFAIGIDRDGTVSGFYNYNDKKKRNHGFLREVDGTIKQFDPPGAINTVASAASSNGMITGDYSNGTASHAYPRSGKGAPSSR